MDKFTNIWKLATISLLILIIVCFGFYFVEFNSVSKNSSHTDTVAQDKQPAENIILITQKEQIKTRKQADYSWIPIYFKTIDKRTEVARLPKLRNISLPKEDLEVRFWFDMGMFLLEGFVLKKNAGQWSAIYLDATEENVSKAQYQKNKNQYQKQLPEPISGWDITWQRLVDAEVLTLPDATELDCNEIVPDGSHLIVEYRINDSYRTYKFDTPSDKCRESKQMGEIYKTIRDEFRFRDYKL